MGESQNQFTVGTSPDPPTHVSLARSLPPSLPPSILCQALSFKFFCYVYTFIPAFFFLSLFIASYMYVGIKLYSRNFTHIVVLWNPFHRLLIKLERNYDSKASVINVFTTFMLLSSSRFIVIEIHVQLMAFIEDVLSNPLYLVFLVLLWMFGLCIPVYLLILFSFKHVALCASCVATEQDADHAKTVKMTVKLTQSLV